MRKWYILYSCIAIRNSLKCSLGSQVISKDMFNYMIRKRIEKYEYPNSFVSICASIAMFLLIQKLLKKI